MAVAVKVQVVSLTAHYKEPQGGFIGTLNWGHMTPTPPHEPPRPEIDPNYVMVGYKLVEEKYPNDQSGAITVKTEDAKKLALMVGDVLTIKLFKDDQ